MPRPRSVAQAAFSVTASLAALTLMVSCSHDGRTLRAPSPGQTQSILVTTAGPTTSVASTAAPAMTLTLPWAEGAAIDARFTCKGDNVSPPISWDHVPIGTEQLALSVVDPDAGGFVHWVIGGLSPASSSIPEGAVPDNAVQARNGAGTVGYTGPCPPSGTHRYVFTLYALSGEVAVARGEEGRTALDVLEGGAFATATATGVFTAG